jgi:hypothetical protein
MTYEVEEIFYRSKQAVSAYYRRTGVFPIMHLVVFKCSVRSECRI